MKALLIFLFLIPALSGSGQLLHIRNNMNSTVEVEIIIDGCVANNTQTFILASEQEIAVETHKSDLYLRYKEIKPVRETNFDPVGETYTQKRVYGNKEYYYFPRKYLRTNYYLWTMH